MFNKVTLLALVGGVSATKVSREPLLSWAPKAKKGKYPVDYFVPNFGVDKDIEYSQRHIE